MQMHIQTDAPTGGRVDRASAIKTVHLGLIPSWIKPKTIKINIHSFLAWRSVIKRNSVEASTVSGRQVAACFKRSRCYLQPMQICK